MPSFLPRSTLATTLAALVASAATASAQWVSVSSPMVAFLATGPGGLQIQGQTEQLSVQDAADTIEVSVPVAQLETGIGLRDRHLRESINAEKYPVAKLVVARSALTFPSDHQKHGGSARGELWLNGQKHALDFSYQMERGGTQYKIQALATLDIRDHGVEVPCYMKLCVEPQVKLKIKFAVQDK
jgi:polyisoprenoid-binding protein YceI